MIRHIVFFRWKEGTTDSEVAAVAEALSTMPEVMDFIRRYEMGADAGISQGSADFALVADFDNEEDWRTYGAHPEHRRIVDEMIAPIAESIDRAQYRI